MCLTYETFFKFYSCNEDIKPAAPRSSRLRRSLTHPPLGSLATGLSVCDVVRSTNRVDIFGNIFAPSGQFVLKFLAKIARSSTSGSLCKLNGTGYEKLAFFRQMSHFIS